MTFGGASRLYLTLKSPIRDQIALNFGVPKLPTFDNWVQCFVDLRNVCAHHDRLFNRRFQKQLQRLQVENVPTALNSTLKAHLECLDHVLDAIHEKSGNVDEARRLINLNIYAAADPAEAGF